MGRRQFGTVRRLASGRYQARYTDQFGHQIAAPGSFTTKTEAMRWLAAAQTDMARGVFVEPTAGQMLFSAWAEEWLATKPGQRAATLARDRTAIQTHFLPIIGDMALGSITPAHIRRVVHEMQATGLSAKVLAADAWRDTSRSLPPPTDNEVSIAKDGRRLDTKERVLAFLAELEAEREAERTGSVASE